MNIYRNKQEFVKGLKFVMGSRDDFKDLEYFRDPSSGEEFLILSSLSQKFVFDITGFKESQMHHTMALVESGYRPDNLVTDREKVNFIIRMAS